MPLIIFIIAFFSTGILHRGSCGAVAPTIGSGSFLIQAGKIYFIHVGSIALSATDIAAFQSPTPPSSKSYIVPLNYPLPNYNLYSGFKKVDWHFHNNNGTKHSISVGNSKSATQFTIYFSSNLGSSLF
jgi:hypothetical protein